MVNLNEIGESVLRNDITRPTWRSDPRVLIGPLMLEDKTIGNFAVYDDKFFIMKVDGIDLPSTAEHDSSNKSPEEDDSTKKCDLARNPHSPNESQLIITHLEPDLPNELDLPDDPDLTKNPHSPMQYHSTISHVAHDLPDEYDLTQETDSSTQSNSMLIHLQPDLLNEPDLLKTSDSNTKSPPMRIVHSPPNPLESPQLSTGLQWVWVLNLEPDLPNTTDTPDENDLTKEADSPGEYHSMIIWQAETGCTWVFRTPGTTVVDFSLSEKYLVIMTKDWRFFVFIFNDNTGMSLDCEDYLSAHHYADPYWSLLKYFNIHSSQNHTHRCDFLRFVGELVDRPVKQMSSWHLRSPYMFGTVNEGQKSSLYKWDLSTCNFVGAHKDLDGHSLTGSFDDEFIIRIAATGSSVLPEIVRVGSIHHKLPLSIPNCAGRVMSYRYIYFERSENVLLSFELNGSILLIDNFDKYVETQDEEKYVHHLDLRTGGANITINYVTIKNRQLVICIKNYVPNNPDGEGITASMIVMFDLRNPSDCEDPFKLPQMQILSVFSLPNQSLKMGDKHVYLAGDINKYKDKDKEILSRCKVVAEAHILKSWTNKLYWKNCEGNQVSSAFQNAQAAVHDLDSEAFKEVPNFSRTWNEDGPFVHNSIFTIDIPHKVNEIASESIPHQVNGLTSESQICPDKKAHLDVELGMS